MEYRTLINIDTFMTVDMVICIQSEVELSRNVLIKRIINKVINILYTENCIERKEVSFSESLVLTIHSLTKDNI